MRRDNDAVASKSPKNGLINCNAPSSSFPTRPMPTPSVSSVRWFLKFCRLTSATALQRLQHHSVPPRYLTSSNIQLLLIMIYANQQHRTLQSLHPIRVQFLRLTVFAFPSSVLSALFCCWNISKISINL